MLQVQVQIVADFDFVINHLHM